jgi:hypothetical protein
MLSRLKPALQKPRNAWRRPRLFLTTLERRL